MCEVASILSMAVGRHISVAMTVEKLQLEIQLDGQYKYLRQVVADKCHWFLSASWPNTIITEII